MTVEHTTQSDLPSVSVIIPTCNRRTSLERTLRSLLAQDYPPDRYEIIVADNSSSDGTGEMIASLRTQARCKLWHFVKPPEGPGRARALGMREAGGEILAFTDSDCVADARWLRAGVTAMTGNAAIVQGKTLPDPSVPWGPMSRSIKITQLSHIYETCNIFYRKAPAMEAGGFSGSFFDLGTGTFGGEDLELAHRVMRLGWASAFADGAVVYHEVSRHSFGSWLIDPHYRLWPLMVRRVPEFRRHFFLRYFLYPGQFWLIVALAGMLGALWWAPCLLLALGYWGDCALRPTRFWRGPLRAVRVLVCLPRDLLILVALTVSSLRHRCVVL